MYKFLFTILPTNDMGLLTRSLPIAFELQKRDHKVVFCDPAEAPGKLIEEAGFDNSILKHPFFTIKSEDLNLTGVIKYLFSNDVKEFYGSPFKYLSTLIKSIPYKNAPSTKEVWDTDHAAAIMGMMNRGFAETQCDAAVRLIEEEKPDAVVDFWNPVTSIATRALRLPLITINQPDALPEGKGFIWWKQKPAGIPSVLPVVNWLMRKYSLSEISKIEELNEGDLTMVLGIPETDPLQGNAEKEYIGSVLWQKPDDEIPEWFNELNDEKPVIWLYPGNLRYSHRGAIFDSEVILGACIEALSSENIQVILTTGHHDIPEEYIPLPGNFRVENYVPGLYLAERCDLMIHHGGYGSFQTSLYSGTPSLVIPTFSERESNARRLAGLGVGEYVLPESSGKRKIAVNSEKIRKSVRRLLTEDSYRDKVITISRKLKAFDGAVKAANMIEKLMKETRRKS